MGHDHVSFFLIVLHCFRTVLKYCVWYDILCVFVFFFFSLLLLAMMIMELYSFCMRCVSRVVTCIRKR